MPKIYKLLIPLEDTEENPLTRDRILDWLIDTKWIENYIHKKISPMDAIYVEDYIQECWVQILEIPADKLVNIYRKGKGKFVNYIKSLINNNIRSTSSKLYQHVRKCRQGEVLLDSDEWKSLEQGETCTTADTSWPERNYVRRNKFTDRIIIRTEKTQIKADDDLYETQDEEG